MMLTPRENLLRVFRHEVPEWIPVTIHMDRFNQPGREGMDPRLQEALGTIDFGDGSELIMAQALELDLMNHVAPPIESKYRRVTTQRIELDDGWATVLKTPCGELREVCKRVRADGTFYRTEHFVKGPEDLRAFCHVFEDEEYAFRENARDFIKQTKTAIGDKGILRAYMPGTPLGMMVRKFTELDTLAYMWADNQDELMQLFGIMEEKYITQFSMAASLGYDALYCTDDTSTTTISPAMFEECCMGFTNRAADAVHRHGTFYVHHSCGHVNRLLELYRQTRMDAVDAVAPRPNDVPSYSLIREKLGPNIAIIGGITWSEDETLKDSPEAREMVAGEIRRIFEDVAPGHNIIEPIYPLPSYNMEQLAFVGGECKRHRSRYSHR